MSRNTAPAAAAFRKEAEDTARDERAIQRRVNAQDKDGKEKKSEAMQAGARVYPVPPVPGQHLPSQGGRPTSSCSPCMTHPVTRVRRS